MCRGEEAAEARAARTLPLGGGGRGLQEIPALRQEIGILTKHSRPGGRSAPGAPASLNPWPAGTRRGGRGGHRGLGVGGGRPPARPHASRPRRPLPPRCPEVEGSGCAQIKTLPLAGLSEPPTPLPQHQEEPCPLPVQWRMNLPSPGRVPCFQIRAMTLPGCPLSRLPLY